MRYLDTFYENQGLQSGLLGNSADAAQNMAAQGEAQAQQARQIAQANEAQMNQTAAMSEQAEAQRQAEEAKRRQAIMQIGMMIAGGIGGGGEAAAEGAAMQPTEELMAQAAPTEFLNREMAAGGFNQYADLLGGRLKRLSDGTYVPMSPGFAGGYF